MYDHFTEGVDFAYWWRCIGKGLRLQPAQQACFYPGAFFQKSNIYQVIRSQTSLKRTYRVADPSCHPQISLCARIQKKTESRTGHPLKWQSPGLATPQKWQSPRIWWVKGLQVLDSAISWGWHNRCIADQGRILKIIGLPFFLIFK